MTAKKYKLAPANTPPAVPLNLEASSPPLTVTLETVIVFRGAGSWKRDARWDEYILTLNNHGAAPEIISSVTLIDPSGVAQSPGEDPWILEKLSRSNIVRYSKAGLIVVEGAGGVLLYGAAAYGAAMGSLMAGGTTGAAIAVLDIIPILAVADITTVAVINHNNKNRINTEFARRRLVLPLTLAAGQTIKGSLFFPLVPSPKQLVISYGSADGTRADLQVELTPLAKLHIGKKI